MNFKALLVSLVVLLALSDLQSQEVYYGNKKMYTLSEAVKEDPDSIYRLRTNYNSFTDGFPEFIYQCRNLRELHLLGVNNEAVPDQRLSALKHLNKLRFVGRIEKGQWILTRFPEVIYELRNLKDLEVRGCNVSELGDGIGNLKKLEKIILDNVNISELPDSVIALEELKEMSLMYTSVSSFPKGFSNLKKLRKLRLEMTFPSFQHLEEGEYPELKLGKDFFGLNLSELWLNQKVLVGLDAKRLIDMRSLKYMSITPNDFTDKDKAKIKESFPNATIDLGLEEAPIPTE